MIIKIDDEEVNLQEGDVIITISKEWNTPANIEIYRNGEFINSIVREYN